MKAGTILARLEGGDFLEKGDFLRLLEDRVELREEVFHRAQQVRQKSFQNKIYIRGLVEFSNICKNDCYYCGIRRSNKKVDRYRIRREELLELVDRGSKMGLKTFVLQGGEDPYFTDEILVDWVQTIKKINPQAAVTLSIGQRPYGSYEKMKKAGADRFLLRHETINPDHYARLHPNEMTVESRIRCLKDLKQLGYQVGAGFMVGSPYQSLENIAEDLVFLQDFRPEMVGMGPYISHEDTPFAGFENGSLDLSVYVLGLVRLLLPKANIPATTALQTLSETGRLEGLAAGANVFMPNLSPIGYREKYSLYKNKAAFALEAMENLEILKEKMDQLGYEVVMSRGDFQR